MAASMECSRSSNSDAAAPLPAESPLVRPSSGSHSPAAIAPMVVAWTAPLAIAYLPIAAVLPQLPHSGPPPTGRAAALLACAVWPLLQLGLLRPALLAPLPPPVANAGDDDCDVDAGGGGGGGGFRGPSGASAERAKGGSGDGCMIGPSTSSTAGPVSPGTQGRDHPRQPASTSTGAVGLFVAAFVRDWRRLGWLALAVAQRALRLAAGAHAAAAIGAIVCGCVRGWGSPCCRAMRQLTSCSGLLLQVGVLITALCTAAALEAPAAAAHVRDTGRDQAQLAARAPKRPPVLCAAERAASASASGMAASGAAAATAGAVIRPGALVPAAAPPPPQILRTVMRLAAHALCAAGALNVGVHSAAVAAAATGFVHGGGGGGSSVLWLQLPPPPNVDRPALCRSGPPAGLLSASSFPTFLLPISGMFGGGRFGGRARDAAAAVAAVPPLCVPAEVAVLVAALGGALAAAIYHMMVPVLAWVFAWAVARTIALMAFSPAAGWPTPHQQLLQQPLQPSLLQQQLRPPQQQAPDARPGLRSGTASAAAQLLAPAQQTEARPQQVVAPVTASLLAAEAAAAVHTATVHTAAAAAMARAGARASALYRSRSRQVTAAFKVGGPTYVGQALVGGCSKHTHMRGRAATTSPYVG